jgi:hypothetical protein
MTCPDCAGVPAGSRATCSCGRGLAWYQPSKQQIATACERIQATWRPQMERSRRSWDSELEVTVAHYAGDHMRRHEGGGN